MAITRWRPSQRIIWIALFAATLLGAGAFYIRTHPNSADISLQPQQRYQTMTGWEATADLYDDPTAPAWKAYASRVLDLAVDEVGINRIRLEVRSGVESRGRPHAAFISGATPYESWKGLRYAIQNDNADPRVIDPEGFDFAELDWHMQQSVLPMIERLKARGEKLWLNICYVSFRSGRYLHLEPEEYAELVLATYLHMRDRYGITPDTWEIILEPDNSENAWTGTDIGRALVASASRLRENGFSPAFIAPSVMDTSNASAFLEDIARVSGALDHVVEISYHRYGGNPERDVPQIARFAAARGLRTGMLEFWFGRGDYHVLLDDLLMGNVSSWQGYVLLGGIYEPASKGDPTLKLHDDARYNAQFFRHVRIGAVRIGAATSARRHFVPVAFSNPDGRDTVVIVAGGRGRLTLQGLKPGRYGVSYAIKTGSAILGDVDVVAGSPLAVQMPGKGVLTVFGKP